MVTKSFTKVQVHLRKIEDPTHTSFPELTIAILSPKRSASSIKCVDMMIVRPFFCFNITSQMARRAYGSTPAVGSSRTTT